MIPVRHRKGPNPNSNPNPNPMIFAMAGRPSRRGVTAPFPMRASLKASEIWCIEPTLQADLFLSTLIYTDICAGFDF